jgi:hypothetical protein
MSSVPLEGELSCSPSYVSTEDVTSLVEECAASLTLAEPFLCHPDSFSLFDSMAATQLGDRKIDCCQVPARRYVSSANPDKTVFPRPPPTGLSDAFHLLPWDDLTVHDTAHIGIQTLIRFQAFLSGSSIGESTATCLYVFEGVLSDMREQLFANHNLEEMLSEQSIQPEQLLESIPNFFCKFIVYAFALSLVEATEDARNIIVNADIYEEEDLTLNSYDHKFLNSNEARSALSVLEVAMPLAKARGKEHEDYKVILLLLNVYFGFLSLAKGLVRLARSGNLYKLLAEARI